MYLPRRLPKGRLTMVVSVLSISLLLVWAVPSTACTGLQHARNDLTQTKQQIRARAAKLRDLQRELNRLATEISQNEAAIAHAEGRMAKLERGVAALTARDERLQASLAERSRETYILGPGAPILYLLSATSAADAVSRISFLDEMTRRDALLAMRVQGTASRLSAARGEQLRTAHAIDLANDRIAEARRRLDLFESVGIERGKVVVVVNRVEKRLFKSIDLGDVDETLGREVLGSLPLDEKELRSAQTQGVLVHDLNRRNKFSVDLIKLAALVEARLPFRKD